MLFYSLKDYSNDLRNRFTEASIDVPFCDLTIFFDVAGGICSKRSRGVRNQMSSGYEISGPASFLFNLAVAQNSFGHPSPIR
jgi:hypothetical protein